VTNFSIERNRSALEIVMTKQRLVFTLIVLLVTSSSSLAGLVVDNFGGPPGATWPASPDGVASPTIAAATAPNLGTVNQTIGANTVIGQTFTVTTPFKIGSVAWTGNGASGVNLSVHLFQFKSTSPYTPASGGYVPASDLSADMLGGGSGVTATYGGAPTTNVLFFNLTGTDEVALAPGIYAFEVWNTSASGSMFLARQGEAYSGGSVYQVTDPNAQSVTSSVSRNNVAGGTRDAIFAVYAAAVPEASAFAMGGALVGLIGLTYIARRKHKAAAA
jgi:hypothetical protein